MTEFNPQSQSDNLDEALAPGADEAAVSMPKAKASRFSIIGFFVVVGVLGLFCVLRMRSGGPSAAAASMQAAQANKTITQFLSGGTQSIRNMESQLRTTEIQVQKFEKYPSVKQVPIGNLKTNPFAYRSDENSAAEAARKAAEAQAAMLKTVATLKVQSIMYSSTRSACMINNSLCAIGTQIGGFTIEKISPSTVEVSQGSYRFELKLQK